MVVKFKVVGGCFILNISMEVDDIDEVFSFLMKFFIREIIGEIELILEEGKKVGSF